MIFGSVCSGIEAASVAWEPLGWKAAFFSEIEKFPCRLLAHRYPDVPNHGDMTKFKEWPDHAIDVLCGGTPCQSFSLAGLRKGLDDARGNLMLTFGEIAARYRPRWLVWENVPGVLSSNDGRDFAAFLGLISGQRIAVPAGGWGTAGIIPGYANAYGMAYRVFDAQYAGLAQRRKRVFVIGYLGDWRPAAAVLLEREGLRGDPAPRRETGQRVAGTLEARAGTGGYDPGAHGAASGHLIAMETGQGGAEIATGGEAPTLTCNHEAPIIVHGTQDPDIAHDRAHTLGRNSGQENAVMTIMALSAVRRLTPRECERLMGFPDDYTLIPKAADGPRYKALGNSWAVPCVQWLGERIEMVNEILREHGK